MKPRFKWIKSVRQALPMLTKDCRYPVFDHVGTGFFSGCLIVHYPRVSLLVRPL